MPNLPYRRATDHESESYRDLSRLILTRRQFAACMTAGLPLVARAGGVSPSAHWIGPLDRGTGWLEWRLSATDEAVLADCFDPEKIDLWCEFVLPDGGAQRATIFWMRDGAFAGWSVRLTPAMTGQWQARLWGRLGGGEVVSLGALADFDVARLSPLSPIVIDPGAPAYFAHADGRPFVPIGLNLCWSSGQTRVDYARWFARLAASGGNFARLWMASWSFGIEWRDTGLGHYHERMARAADLDAILEMAEHSGVRIMLCLLNHGAFSLKTDTQWAENPYNQANGGPIADPSRFAMDPAARAMFARRLRYIAARWSHSPALHSWEWWNEVNWTRQAPEQIRDWIRHMSPVLQQHDPYRRLRTCSWSDQGDTQTWQMDELDFVQQHDYTGKDLMTHYRDAARKYRGQGIGKPMLPGELGLNSPAGQNDAKLPTLDGIHLHNGLWASLFNGYAGSAMYWWWNTVVDAHGLWPEFLGIAQFMKAVHDAGLRLGDHVAHPVRVLNSDASALALRAKGSVLVWVRSRWLDTQAQRALGAPKQGNSPAYVLVPSASVVIDDLPWKGAVPQVRWFDPQSGEPVLKFAAPRWLGKSSLEVPCAPFDRDLAALIQVQTAQ